MDKGNMSKESDQVTFTPGQYAYLQSLYPTIVQGPNVTEAQLRYYHGQQSVLFSVKEKTRGLSPAKNHDPMR